MALPLKFLAAAMLAATLSCSRLALEPSCDEADVCQVSARVSWLSIEGGFWALRGDDDVTYEPLNLPADFQQDGLRVRTTLRMRGDMGTYRMVGPVVEVLSIHRQ
jgi:hypothetical protein